MEKQIPKPNNVPSSGSSYLSHDKGGELSTPWRTLVVMLIVFGLTVLFWLGMSLGYIPYLKSQIKGVDSNLQSLSSKMTKKQRLEFADAYSQLYNIKKLVSSRIDMSKFFTFLEASTYPNTVMKNLEFHLNKNSVRMSFIVPSFTALTEQIKSYSAYPGVIKVLLSSSEDSSVNDNKADVSKVNASIELFFNKNFFMSNK